MSVVVIPGNKAEATVELSGQANEIMHALDWSLAAIAVDELEVLRKCSWRKLGARRALEALAQMGELSIEKYPGFYRVWIHVSFSEKGGHSGG